MFLLIIKKIKKFLIKIGIKIQKSLYLQLDKDKKNNEKDKLINKNIIMLISFYKTSCIIYFNKKTESLKRKNFQMKIIIKVIF